jgi:Mn-dependent DtxR family transcriptional regulator
MSLEKLVDAFNTEVGDPSAHLLLMRLADYYNDEVGYAWPSVDTLADKLHVSRRTVQNKLRYLEERGFISIETRHDDTSKYRLLVGGENSAPRAKSAPKRLTDNISNNIKVGRKICTPRTRLLEFKLDDALRNYAASYDVNADDLLQRLVDYYTSMNRIPDRNWPMTFQAWCRREKTNRKLVADLPDLEQPTEKQSNLMQMIVKKAQQQFGAEYFDYHRLMDGMRAEAIKRGDIKSVAKTMGVNLDG